MKVHTRNAAELYISKLYINIPTPSVGSFGLQEKLTSVYTINYYLGSTEATTTSQQRFDADFMIYLLASSYCTIRPLSILVHSPWLQCTRSKICIIKPWASTKNGALIWQLRQIQRNGNKNKINFGISRKT